MISLETAKQRVLERLPALGTVRVDLVDALDCVLSGDAVARESIPPFDNTAVDGFAVRSVDVANVPTTLRVVGEVRAGGWPDRPVGPGEAIRIMTGAPVPEGADAIVMVEQTESDGDTVIVRARVTAGESIRPAGDDVVPGDVVLRSKTVLAPSHLGILAGLGERSVEVHPRLRVGVLSTGDELVGDGGPLGPGQIRESNRDLLLGLVREANCIPVDLGIVVDEEEALTTALLDATRRCDALITSGGVSMGDYDLVKVLLDRLGTMEWMQIAIRPAKPFAFGLLPGEDAAVPVFGLPGNPVSSMVSFELLARPALLAMMGHEVIERPTALAVADVRIRRNPSDERVNFVRVLARLGDDGRIHVSPTGAQGSHQLANSAGANGLVRLEQGAGVEAGDEVRVLLTGVRPSML